MRAARSASSVRTRPPGGPPRLLYVLIVMTSAPSASGFGHTPPAMRPHTCAASKSTRAPTRSAIARIAATGCGSRLRLPPIVISLGRTRSAIAAKPVEIGGVTLGVDRHLVDVEAEQARDA